MRLWRRRLAFLLHQVRQELGVRPVIACRLLGGRLLVLAEGRKPQFFQLIQQLRRVDRRRQVRHRLGRFGRPSFASRRG